MSLKLNSFLNGLVVGILVIVLMMTPAMAAAPPVPADNINAAAGPLAGWVTIEPGATQWYRFKYAYDNSDKDNEALQALVELEKAAPSNLSFEVWTPSRLNAPLPDPSMDRDEQGTVREPVGMGTPMYLETTWHREGPYPQHKHFVKVYDSMCLTWAGSAKATDTYYIVVKNKGTETALYELTISGPTVSF